MRTAKTTDYFIEKAKKVHENNYDYSLSDYVKADEKVIIVCKKHGKFLQTPANHYREGCPVCSEDKFRSSTEEFIKKALLIHKNKFDYSKVNYINALTKVEIVCKKHGSFFQTVGNHITHKRGCRLCDIEKRRKIKIPKIKKTPIFKRKRSLINKEVTKRNSRILDWAKKLKLITLFGGKCLICSENRFWVLCFHHKNPENKIFGISQNKKVRYEQLFEEAKKCDLLCKNCHSEIHLRGKTNKNILNKKYCLEYKRAYKCKFCGYNNIDSLEFHHLKNKLLKISDLIIKGKWGNINDLPSKIKEELDKCEVLCPNCHSNLHTDSKFLKDNEKNILEKSLTLTSTKKINCEKVIDLHKQGLSRQEISNFLKCSVARIYEILKAYGYNFSRKDNHENLSRSDFCRTVSA